MAAQPASAVERAVETHLLIDGGMVKHYLTEGMHLVPGPVVKDDAAGVMLHEDFFSNPPRRWEVRYDNGYPTVLKDPATGTLRLYYSLFVIDPSSANTPLERRPHETYEPTKERVVAWAVAESVDGVTWTKPELGIVEFDGDTANNLLMIRAHGTGIMLDEDDPDPRRRYKVVTRIDLPDGGRAFGTMFSEDGLHFSPVHAWKEPVPRADTHNAPFRDPRTGTYGITTRVWKDGIRVCVLSTSPDFERWTEPHEILRSNPPASQIYSMPIFTHRNQYIGLSAIFHEGDRHAPDFDLVDCELATAHDLDSWQMVAPGRPLIPRGAGSYPDGAFDNACIYAACPVEIDGETWIYYFGGNGRHTGFRETGLGRVRVDLDRLAGYRTVSDREGRLVIGPFTAGADDFALLADVPNDGSLSWRLVDAEGRALAEVGEAWRDLSAGHGWRALQGGPAMERLRGRAICIDLRAQNAQIFAVRTSCAHQRFH